MKNSIFYLIAIGLSTLEFVVLNKMVSPFLLDYIPLFLLLLIPICAISLGFQFLYVLATQAREFKIRVLYPFLLGLFFTTIFLAYNIYAEMILGRELYRSIFWFVPVLALCILYYLVFAKTPKIQKVNVFILMYSYALSGVTSYIMMYTPRFCL